MSAHQSAVEQSQSPALLVGLDLRVQHANDGAHALLGYAPGHLLGERMTSLFQPRRQAELRNFEQLLAGGGARRWRTALRSQDGRRRDVAIALTACLDDSGRVEAVHVRLEEASFRTSSAPPGSRISGVHSYGSSEAAFEIPEDRIPRRPSTSPPPGEALREPTRETVKQQLLYTALDEVRHRLIEVEALAAPTSETLSDEARAELSRLSRDALTLLDRAIRLTQQGR